jgi:hypothetical protein
MAESQTLIEVTDSGVALDRGRGYIYSFNSAECVHLDPLGLRDGGRRLETQPTTMTS